MGFREYVWGAGGRVLEGFGESVRAEIYVVSFRIWHLDQDVRRPYVAIGYNTESEYRRVVAELGPDSAEARWNYAYWPLDGFEMIGNVPEDPEGSAQYLAEVKELGLWYEDGDYGDDDPGLETRWEALGRHFDDACIDLARHLRATGQIAGVLGRDVPVVVFDMDRPGWEVSATKAANPPEVIASYLAEWGWQEEESP